MKKRLWRGMVMREAVEPTMVRAVEQDGGTPGDPGDCRFQHALQRTFPGCMAAVYRTVTLVETEPGVVTRYQNSAELRAAIEDFDRTGVMPAGTFRLLPVPAGRTLEARSHENRVRGDHRPRRPRRVANTGIGNGKPPRIGRGHYRSGSEDADE